MVSPVMEEIVRGSLLRLPQAIGTINPVKKTAELIWIHSAPVPRIIQSVSTTAVTASREVRMFGSLMNFIKPLLRGARPISLASPGIGCWIAGGIAALFVGGLIFSSCEQKKSPKPKYPEDLIPGPDPSPALPFSRKIKPRYPSPQEPPLPYWRPQEPPQIIPEGGIETEIPMPERGPEYEAPKDPLPEPISDLPTAKKRILHLPTIVTVRTPQKTRVPEEPEDPMEKLERIIRRKGGSEDPSPEISSQIPLRPEGERPQEIPPERARVLDIMRGERVLPKNHDSGDPEGKK